MALPASDNFNRADGEIESASWVNVGTLNYPEISASRLIKNTLGDGSAYWNADSFNANHYAECNVITADDGGPGVRGSASGIYYFSGTSGTNTGAVWRYRAPSTWNQIGSSFSITFSASNTLRLEATGTTTTTLKVYVNGSVAATLTDSSSPLMSGAAGVYAAATTVLDNWAADNVSSATTYTETGGAQSGLTARGVDQSTFSEAGQAQSAATITGTYTKTGAATTYEETGGATSAATARAEVWYPIVYVGSGTNSGSSGDLLMTPPATILNDLLICTVTTKDNVACTFPAGWYIVQEGNNGASLRTTVAWKRATGAEGQFTITHTGGDTITAGVAVYRNALAVGNPIDTSSLSPNGSSSTCTGTSITTLSLYTLIVFVMHDSDNGASSAQACATTPTVMRERFDVTETGGTDAAVSVADMWIGPATATGNATGTFSLGPDVTSGTLLAIKHALSETKTGVGISGATASGAAERITGPTVNEETGSAIGALTARALDAVTFSDTGAATSAETARGTDAVIFTETGAAISAATMTATRARVYERTGRAVGSLTASGTKASIYGETGTAIVNATIGGTATQTSPTAGGSPIGLLLALTVGIPTGPTVYTEMGSGISAATATATKVLTYTDAGAGLIAISASGADTTTFVDSGLGLVSSTATGISEFVPKGAVIYTETGGAVSALMARGAAVRVYERSGAAISSVTARGADAVIFSEAGQAQSAATITGADIATFSETGHGIAGVTISGTASLGVTYVETGGAIASLTVRGADTAIFAEAGLGLSSATISGADTVTFSNSGAAVVGLTVSGADTAIFTDSGRGIVGTTATGASEYIAVGAVTYTEAGGAFAAATISGADVVILTEAGRVIGAVTASGIDQTTQIETGRAISGVTIGGASEFVPRGTVIYAETGAAIGTVTASGYDRAIFSDAGLGLLAGVPLGADAVTMTRSGYGLVGVTAHGPGQAFNTAFALVISNGRVRLLNSIYEVDQTQEYGIDLITTLKEVEDGR